MLFPRPSVGGSLIASQTTVLYTKVIPLLCVHVSSSSSSKFSLPERKKLPFSSSTVGPIPQEYFLLHLQRRRLLSTLLRPRPRRLWRSSRGCGFSASLRPRRPSIQQQPSPNDHARLSPVPLVRTELEERSLSLAFSSSDAISSLARSNELMPEEREKEREGERGEQERVGEALTWEHCRRRRS